MIHSGAFSCLNNSFRTIQMLEWFIHDHSVAWMIHSGHSKKNGHFLNNELDVLRVLFTRSNSSWIRKLYLCCYGTRTPILSSCYMSLWIGWELTHQFLRKTSRKFGVWHCKGFVQFAHIFAPWATRTRHRKRDPSVGNLRWLPPKSGCWSSVRVESPHLLVTAAAR